MVDKKFNTLILSSKTLEASFFEEINEKALLEFSCDGIEEFSLEEYQVDQILGDRAYSGGDIPEAVLDEVEFTTKEKDEITYKYFFYSKNHLQLVDIFKEHLKTIKKDFTISVVESKWEDWNEEWRKHYKTLHVSDRLKIIPEWEKKGDYKNQMDSVYIYPGMGFGTGGHETTFLCMQIFDEIRDEFKPGSNCLDFGCGSGILGIAAIKMSKMLVEFCDIDTAALDNCVQNLELNFNESDLAGHRLVIRDRYSSEKKFNLVFANILEHVLEVEKKVLMEALDKGSYLVVSGLLNHQVQNITKKYSELSCEKVVSKGDWSAILFKK